VALTKTKPDRKALKEGVVQTVRDSVDKYTNLFVISFENLRSTKFKELRREWAEDSR
jgi:ribosomal protein L10